MKNLFGTIRTINPVQTFKNSDFKTQNIIIETLETNTPIPVQFNNSNIEKLQDLLLGQNVKIGYAMKGRYDRDDKNKCWLSLEGFNITVLE